MSGTISTIKPVRPGQSRLKPIHTDYLESIGLVSKGDESLLNHRTQEAYFDEIVKRYKAFVPTNNPESAIDEAFQSLSLDDDTPKKPQIHKNDLSRTYSTALKPQPSTLDPHFFSTLLTAMRKLREALVSSSRLDTFSYSVYIFIIRTTILLKHMESYHPALLYFLHTIDPAVPSSADIKREFLGYLILDLACRQNDFNYAFFVREKFGYRDGDGNVNAVLRALVQGNWVRFWEVQGRVSVLQSRLMEWAEERMRRMALGCLGKSYLVLDKSDLEKFVKRSWEEVKKLEGVPWELEGKNVVIRKVGRK